MGSYGLNQVHSSIVFLPFDQLHGGQLHLTRLSSLWTPGQRHDVVKAFSLAIPGDISAAVRARAEKLLGKQ